MPLTREPLAGESRDLRLVGDDGVHLPAGLRRRVHEHDGHVIGDVRLLDALVVHAGDQEAVDALGEEARDEVALRLGIAAALGDHQQHVALEPGATGTLDDAARERSRREVIADEPDDAGASAAQSAGHPIGDVAELTGDGEDPLAGLGVHRPCSTQRKRHRRRRDARGGGDVADARAPAGLARHTPSLWAAAARGSPSIGAAGARGA